VSAIALICLILLCTPVQLDCSLVALQADLLFTPVNTCSVYSLEALQTDFKDPFLWPPTHSCENILLAFELYEIEISVATSICRLLVLLLSISSSFIMLLINEQLRLLVPPASYAHTLRAVPRGTTCITLTLELKPMRNDANHWSQQ
jgi:hypothetical protein